MHQCYYAWENHWPTRNGHFCRLAETKKKKGGVGGQNMLQKKAVHRKGTCWVIDTQEKTG